MRTCGANFPCDGNAIYRRASLLLGMLCCVVSLSAAQPSGQDSHTTPEAQQDRITLHVKDADIAEVLKFCHYSGA